VSDRARRLAAGVSLGTLSRAAGISKVSLSLAERGKRRLSDSTLARVESALDRLERRARVDALRREAGIYALKNISSVINYGRP